MFTRETEIKQDGSIWWQWTLPSEPQASLILTSKGRELVHERPDILGLIRRYKLAVMLGRSASTYETSRQPFKHGSNSDVYELASGSDFVVKECKTAQSMYYALNRMDTLKTVIEKGHVPRWIDMPIHYGLITTPMNQPDYLLMQKIDAGITVADIVGQSREEAMADQSIVQEFNDITVNDVCEVSDRFNMAKDILSTALSASDHDPKDFLTDWDWSNVLVERLNTPIAGSRFMFWVIDQ